MQIKTIITNELYSVLGHNPTEEEFSSAVDYVKDSIRYKISQGKRVDLSDVSCFFLDWRDDNCVQCANCGDYFLPDEDDKDDYGNWLCCRDCEIEFYKEKEYAEQHKRELQRMFDER